MGQILHWGLLQGREPVGDGRIMGVEANVHNKLAEVWGFVESDREKFDEEILDGWIHGQDMEVFSKDLFESVEVAGLWRWRPSVHNKLAEVCKK